MQPPNKTLLGAPPAVDPNKTRMGSPPGFDPNRTILGGAPNLNVTTTLKPVQCPVCKTFNPVGVKWCVECGLIFEFALDGDAFGAPAVQLPVLIESSGKEHVLRPGLTVVGRQGDIIVEDTRASRRHCQFESQQGTVTVEDLGSTNGTLVNGQKLNSGEKRQVVAGDKVSLGGYELTVGMPGEAQKTLAAIGGRTAAISAAPTTSSAVAWLVLPDTEVPLSEGSMVFGRKSEHPICIPDPYVSSKHGLIEVETGSVYLTDTGSTNGTVLNGVKLGSGQRVQLQKGDVIKLGSVEITLRFKE
ncbi:MAG: FHA domain-containing protein [Fimbriimonadaceae bacterium]|jgi:pSer/pThr/pTyr-binding forkhead associated (FHA) protein|nr:FHA domain-containing protein [Fimbriimonadaceae bacterium]